MAEKEKQYWMHRINGGENGWMLSYSLLKEYNILSIGWSCLSSASTAQEIKKRGISAINEAYNERDEILRKNRYCLLNFVSKMKRGDVVIVPTAAYFSIYRIIDDYVLTNESIPDIILEELDITRTEDNELYKGENYIDLGFYRKVSPIYIDIPRNDYATDEIYDALRLRAINSNISSGTIMKSIGRAIAAFKKRQPLIMPVEHINTEYNRWETTKEHSWAYRIFRRCNDDLMEMRMAYLSAKIFTFKKLTEAGAQRNKKACEFLYTNNDEKLTINEWIDAYTRCGNWMRLNQLMALTGSFESYLAAVIKLSIESDPGILLEKPHIIDGMWHLKYDIKLDNIETKEIIEECTKKEWSKRMSGLKRLFMELPPSFTKYEGELEKMRIMRNNIGHAFGRDIDTIHSYDLYQLPKMESLSSGRFKKWQKIVIQLASDLDKQVMKKHVGNFQPLYFCHTIREELNACSSMKEKTERLKTKLYIEAKEVPYAKSLCEWIISYYDSL